MFGLDVSRRAAILNELFRGYDGPVFAIRLWDGWSWSSSASSKVECTVVLKSPRVLRSLIASPNEITLGEAFIRGDLDVEGDIFTVFPMAEYLFNRPQSLSNKIAEKLAGMTYSLALLRKHGRVNSLGRDRASISYHYDQPVAFYEPWLGKSMVYSCAYFRSEHDSLDQAQAQKLDLICRKLRLAPGERFLDIGCGWGSLLLEAADRRQVVARGITLSREQAGSAQRRIERVGCGQSCHVELCDYRRMNAAEPAFDKIASVGMFEHVGFKNLPLYFSTAFRLLRPGGLFLNHGIAHSYASPKRASSFISRYVFPGGRLVTLSETIGAAESQGFEVRDVECLREHYEMTLRRWVDGLRQNAAALLKQVSEVTYRIWLLYMAGSAAAFRRGDIGVYQVLLSKPYRGKTRLPLTREDLYAPEQLRQEAAV
jgi:cyclopropane-fatty-acyl-phospholipid synthase